MALMSALCALTLAVLVGACSALTAPEERADARWVPAHPEWRAPRTISSAPSEGRERLASLHEPLTPARLKPSRPTGKRAPHPVGSASRHDLAVQPWVRTVPCPGMLLSGGLPPCQGHPADRPVTANCPAQGPPPGA